MGAFLLIIHILSERFYLLLFETDKLVANFLLPPLIITLPYFLLKAPKNFFINYKTVIIFTLYCFISSVVMGVFNIGQSMSSSILSSRTMLVYPLLVPVLVYVYSKVNIQSIYRYIFFTSIFLILVNFYVFLSGDLSFYKGNIIFRVDQLRLAIGQWTMIYSYLFLISSLRYKKLSFFPAFGLMLTFIFVVKTRSIIAPLLLISIIEFFRGQNLFRIIKIAPIIVFGLSFIVISGLGISLYNQFSDLFFITLSDSDNNIAVRLQAILYYWNNLNFWSLIFGYGMEEHRTFLYFQKYYLVVLGLFSIFYYWGLLGITLFFIFLKELNDLSNQNNLPIVSNFAKNIVIFQLTAVTLTSLTYPTVLIFILSTYIILKNSNYKSIGMK